MTKENRCALKRQRIEHVNQVIRIIANRGRRFLYSQSVIRWPGQHNNHLLPPHAAWSIP